LLLLKKTPSAGRGIVTQEFCELKWDVASLDNGDLSFAMIRQNILDLKLEDLPFVPDFIWASVS